MFYDLTLTLKVNLDSWSDIIITALPLSLSWTLTLLKHSRYHRGCEAGALPISSLELTLTFYLLDWIWIYNGILLSL